MNLTKIVGLVSSAILTNDFSHTKKLLHQMIDYAVRKLST